MVLCILWNLNDTVIIILVLKVNLEYLDTHHVLDQKIQIHFMKTNHNKILYCQVYGTLSQFFTVLPPACRSHIELHFVYLRS